MTDVPLSTVAAVLNTTDGPIVGIFHQYAHYGKGHTLHLPLQLEAFGHKVSDADLVHNPGTQKIVTPAGYTIPLSA